MEKFSVALVCTLAVLHLSVRARAYEVFYSKSVAEEDLEPEARIVGGREVISRIPHQVAVEVRLWNQDVTSILCGGALISDSVVLTAAQCLDRVTRPLYEVRVTAGGVFMNANITDGNISPAKNVIVHPQWNNRSMENDIGIVVTFAFPTMPGIIEPIRLPSKRTAFWSHWAWSATTSGWGRVATDGGANTTVLRAVDTRILKNIYCKFRYSNELIRDTNICASGFSQKGICKGDEGGPLFVKELDRKLTLLGIASFKGFPGMPCETSLPSVYTRVGGYLDWIQEKANISIRQF